VPELGWKALHVGVSWHHAEHVLLCKSRCERGSNPGGPRHSGLWTRWLECGAANWSIVVDGGFIFVLGTKMTYKGRLVYQESSHIIRGSCKNNYRCSSTTTPLYKR